MPNIISQFYKFTGWTNVEIYSQQEMADVLNLSLTELYHALEHGHLAYHAHPLSNNLNEYQFTPKIYQENQQRWACIQSGGHHFEFDHYYDNHLKKAVYKCQTCPADRYD